MATFCKLHSVVLEVAYDFEVDVYVAISTVGGLGAAGVIGRAKMT